MFKEVQFFMHLKIRKLFQTGNSLTINTRVCDHDLFVRSFLSCSREPLTGHDSNMDLTSIEDRRGRQRTREDRDTGRARCASLDTRAMSDYSDIMGGYSARSRQVCWG